jgi:hypothetical protein
VTWHAVVAYFALVGSIPLVLGAGILKRMLRGDDWAARPAPTVALLLLGFLGPILALAVIRARRRLFRDLKGRVALFAIPITHFIALSLLLNLLLSTTVKPFAVPNRNAVFSQRQRSTQPLPGSQGRILLTIDDITRGQVLISASADDGEPILSPRSLRPNQSIDFTLQGSHYTLILEGLRNSLIGDDYASFRIVQGARDTSALTGGAR